MPVQITCRKTKLDDHLQGLVEKKTRNLKKYFEKVDKIEVVFTAEKYRRVCEINVHAAPFSLVAQAENETEGHAFDKALKSVQRQIRDRKNKMIDRSRRVQKEHGVLPTELDMDASMESESRAF